MPRRTSKGVKKSVAIREVLAQNPKAKASEVIAELAGRGIKVSSSMIYIVKGNLLYRRRKLQRAHANEPGRPTTNAAQLVLKVKELASHAGGMKNLRELVDALTA